MGVKLYESKRWLYRKYLVEKKNAEQIAKEAGCSRKTIYNKLNEFGFVRPKS